MSKHTPGPWIKSDEHVLGRGEHNTVAVVANYTNFGAIKFCSLEDETLALSAPDLLAALEKLENAITEFCRGNIALINVIDPRDEARAAIAKAKGDPCPTST